MRYVLIFQNVDEGTWYRAAAGSDFLGMERSMNSVVDGSGERLGLPFRQGSFLVPRDRAERVLRTMNKEGR